MKKLLLFLFMIPVALCAQDSLQLQECKVKEEADPYTRKIKFSSGFFPLQGANLSIQADEKEIDFFFIIPEKCFEANSTAYIYFEGSKIRLTQRNTGSMNCDGYFHFIFRNSPTPLTNVKKLSTMPVAQFIFIGADKKETIVGLTPTQQQTLMQAAGCVVNESKRLLPVPGK